MCYPSDGGIIVADEISIVELEYLGLPLFQGVERSYDATLEDAFCRQLRKLGGKWWEGYHDFNMANYGKYRHLSAVEKEILYLA